MAADHRTVIGEIRLAQSGTGVYHVQVERYVLSPEELEELLRAVPVGV